MYSYKDIVKDLLTSIKDGKYKVDQKLPSEHALTIKYGVSRIVASRAFSELRKIGAIYSISKKGNFVAKFFEGLIKPISYQYNVDNFIEEKMEYYEPSYFKNYEVLGDFKTFKRRYTRGDKTIIWTENWLNKDLMHSEDGNLTDVIMQQSEIISCISISIFEKWTSSDNVNSLVTYRILYSNDGIALITRFKVVEEELRIIKQEFVI